MSDKTDAGFLLPADFERAVDVLPLVSVDWVLLNPAGQMLLGQLRNAPAQHWWFTPGGRVGNRPLEPLALEVEFLSMEEVLNEKSKFTDSQIMDVVKRVECLTSTILTARRQLFWPVEAGNELNSLFT